MKPSLIFSFFFILASYANPDYLILKRDKKDNCYYVNRNGDIIIPVGKYGACFTDTFRNMAIVSKPRDGFVGINREEKVLFHVFPFDNGPDDLAEGYFRIIENGKIGYADINGSIKIQPQYGCAFPFEHGIAKVSMNCKTTMYGEHSAWDSDSWFYINKAGKKVK